MKNMNVNFKGLYYRNTSSCNLSNTPNFNELEQNHSSFRVKFTLLDDKNGNDLSEFKQVITDTKFKPLFASNKYENIFLDIQKSDDAKEYGYKISLSGEPIDQQDQKSIFRILTFLCAATKFLMTSNTNIEQLSIKHLKMANNILDKVAKQALKR